MILLIDNYDSFVYNLYQMTGSMYPDIQLIRNDQMTPEEMASLKPSALMISPGPGRPKDAGYSMEAIRYFTGKIPILGVCLGHQAICEVFGGKISYARELMHGKSSEIQFDPHCRLFQGLDSNLTVARYHSLCAVREDLPACLKVSAWSRDNEVMAVEHRTEPVFGVQFHPESVMTRNGSEIINNFLKEVLKDDTRCNC